MQAMNLKTGISGEGIADRLQYNPSILELVLSSDDLRNLLEVERTIESLQARGIKVYLHHPMRYNGKYLNLVSDDEEVITYTAYSTGVLASIAQRHDVSVVIHANYSEPQEHGYLPSVRPTLQETLELKSRLEFYHAMGVGKHFLWENSCHGLMSTHNQYYIDEVIVPLKLPTTWDISHAFVGVGGDNALLLNDLNRVSEYTKYFHIVDSLGLTHDALEIGKGSIDWIPIVPHVLGKDYILEIGLKPPHNDCTPMVNSAVTFSKMIQDYLITM